MNSRKNYILSLKTTAFEIMQTATVDELKDYAREGVDCQEDAIIRVAAKKELLKRGHSIKEFVR